MTDNFNIFFWAIINTVIELISSITSGLKYEQGWCIIWSFVLFFIAFILILSHYKKPLFVWPISLACGIGCALIFGLPPVK
jgi:hypothetical protein